MITYKVTKTDKLISIDIKGHAGYAKYGQDIVCSSVTTMIFFFINCVKRYAENSIKHLKIKDGDVEIKLDNVEIIKPLLEVFQYLLDDVGQQYPQCLKEVKSND